MPTLAEELTNLNSDLVKRLPAEIVNQLQKEVERVGREGIVTGLEIGDTAPNFTLPDATGNNITLYDQLEKGPVILSFYRGAW